MAYGPPSAMPGSQDLYISWPQFKGGLWKEAKDPGRLQYLDICSPVFLAKDKGWWHIAFQVPCPRA